MRKLLITLSLLLIPIVAFAFTYEWIIDQMEYANDGAAQAAYVTSASGLPSEYSTDGNTVLLVHFNEADGNTSPDDASASNHTINNNGNVQTDNAVTKFGNTSVFDGTGDFWTINDHADWAWGTGNWTVDFWIRYTGAWEDGGYFDQWVDSTHNLTIGSNSTRVIYFRIIDGTTDVVCYTALSTNPAADTWMHIAVVRYGTGENNMYIFLNGVSVGLTFATTLATNYPFPDFAANAQIGYSPSVGGYWTGWIEELRVSKGIARWTSNFDVTALQSYSESTIKQQGSYSLKGVATDGALNETLTKTLTNKLDLTNAEGIEYDIYASRTGSNIKLSIHDSGGTTSEHTANVVSSNTNQTESWDISGISDANKNDIDEIKVTIVNADSSNTFYLDDIKFGITPAAGGSWGFIE